MRGERVAKRVTARSLRDPRRLHRPLHGALHDRVVQMTPAQLTRRRIPMQPRCRKHPLPHPRPARRRHLHAERIRQLHRPRPRPRPQAARKIIPMQPLHPPQMLVRQLPHAHRQHRYPILAPLPPPHHDLAPREVHVLHPQLERLQQPQPGAVQQRRHESRHAAQLRQNGLHLGGREHDGQPHRLARPHHPLGFAQLHRMLQAVDPTPAAQSLRLQATSRLHATRRRDASANQNPALWTILPQLTRVTISRPISRTVRQPASARVRSKSAKRFSITAATPASPASANPYTYGRPMHTAAAPRARALNTSAPVRTPESSSTGTRPPTASTTAGSASSVAIAPSTCRPPWFDTTSPSTPASSARRASSGWSMPLSSSGSLVSARSRGKSAQLSDGRGNVAANRSTASPGSARPARNTGSLT